MFSALILLLGAVGGFPARLLRRCQYPVDPRGVPDVRLVSDLRLGPDSAKPLPVAPLGVGIALGLSNLHPGFSSTESTGGFSGRLAPNLYFGCNVSERGLPVGPGRAIFRSARWSTPMLALTKEFGGRIRLEVYYRAYRESDE